MEQQRVILVGLATGSVVARGALWTCAWSRVVDRTLSLGNGLLDPKMAKIHRCAGLQNKRLFIAKGKGAPRKADFFACLSGARPKPMPIHPHTRLGLFSSLPTTYLSPLALRFKGDNNERQATR